MNKNQFKRLEKFIREIPFFDMHSHMAGFDLGGPVDDKSPVTLYEIMTNDYLAYLSGACLDKSIIPAKLKEKNDTPSYSDIRDLLDKCRALTTYYATREGIRILYPFKEPDIDENNWDKINKKIMKTYARYGERQWQRIVCERANVFRQVHIATLPYVTRHLDSLPEKEKNQQLNLLAPSLVLDGYIFTGFKVQHDAREMSFDIVGKHPENLDEYLGFCDDVLELFKKKGGKSVKLLCSYSRPLRFEEVSRKRAEQLFNVGHKNLSKDALRVLQDYLLRTILTMAKEKNLPLIVHTGYSNPTTYGDPENLENLFRSPELNGLNISICHSGWPNEGKAMIMARTYRNCFFDLTWTPLLSEALGYRILSEAIDIIPVNKILIGTDCGTAECFIGTVDLIRKTICSVLVDKIQKGFFDTKTAMSVAKAILHDNPIEFHNENRGEYVA